MNYLPEEVTGRLVPGLTLWNALSTELLVPLIGRDWVPGLAKPDTGRPTLLRGRTPGFMPFDWVAGRLSEVPGLEYENRMKIGIYLGT
jgi:hypothetical protein